MDAWIVTWDQVEQGQQVLDGGRLTTVVDIQRHPHSTRHVLIKTRRTMRFDRRDRDQYTAVAVTAATGRTSTR